MAPGLLLHGVIKGLLRSSSCRCLLVVSRLSVGGWALEPSNESPLGVAQANMQLSAKFVGPLAQTIKVPLGVCRPGGSQCRVP